MVGSFLVELLLILRHAHGVAAHASIESLPFLLVPRLLNTDHHPNLVVSCSDAGDLSILTVLILYTVPICSTLLAPITTQIWWYPVLPLGILMVLTYAVHKLLNTASFFPRFRPQHEAICSPYPYRHARC